MTFFSARLQMALRRVPDKDRIGDYTEQISPLTICRWSPRPIGVAAEQRAVRCGVLRCGLVRAALPGPPGLTSPRPTAIVRPRRSSPLPDDNPHADETCAVPRRPRQIRPR